MDRPRNRGLLGSTLASLLLLPLGALACRGEDRRVEDVGVEKGAQAEPAEPGRSQAARPADPSGDTGTRAATRSAPAPSIPSTGTTPGRAPSAAGRPLVVFLGDSLTAGLGLEAEQAFPARVEDRLEELGTPIRVVNAGVSGDTSAGGLRRLDWLLRQKPAVLVVGLGANDGLRGLPVGETEKNLREIVRRAQAAGVRVLLLGMMIPPNYGDYAAEFGEVYPRLARDLGVPLVPFLLDGVGGVPELNLPDGLHPNVEGQERVADNVVPRLRELVAGAG